MTQQDASSQKRMTKIGLRELKGFNPIGSIFPSCYWFDYGTVSFSAAAAVRGQLVLSRAARERWVQVWPEGDRRLELSLD